MKTIIIAVVFLLLFGLLMALPSIHIDPNAVVASSAFSFVRAALYFIPVRTCTAILSINLGLWIWRVIVSLVKTIWNLLPIG